MITEELDAALLAMVEHATPAAIVMDVRKLKALLREGRAHDRLSKGPEGSGWTFDRVPVWRSKHLTGLAVLSDVTFAQVRHLSFSRFDTDGVTHDDLLF